MCNERVLAEYATIFRKNSGTKSNNRSKIFYDKIHWRKSWLSLKFKIIDTKCTEKKIEKQNKIKKYRFLNFPSQITKLLMFKNSRSFSITIMDKEELF